MNTKTRIIESAIKLFNEEGFGKIGLADIARNLSLSNSHLAYHFHNKDQLLLTISKMLDKDCAIYFKYPSSIPSFNNLQSAIKAYFKLNHRYKFVFGNDSVLQDQCINEVIQKWSKKTIQDVLDAFAFGVQVGNMKLESMAGVYHNLAINTWMIIHFWGSQKNVRGDHQIENAEKMVWSILVPHLTKMGLEQFNNYRNENQVGELGPSFDSHLAKLKSF